MIDDKCYHVKDKDGNLVSTNVLINRLDIRDNDLLQVAERRLVSLRLLEIFTVKPIKGNFDFNHLRSINRYIFQDLYDWAGETRDCNIEKRYSLFCDVKNINSFGNDIFNRLRHNNYYINLDDDEKIVSLADLFGDINALHPFREGNGRTQREFVEDLGRVNGLDIDITSISKNDMIKASIYSMYGDNTMLCEEFRKRCRKLTIDEQMDNIDKYCSEELAKYLKGMLGKRRGITR